MIRLLIADDQAVVRAGLSVILGAEPDIEVVGEAIDGADAVRLAKELRPDLICMDIRMPGTDGIAATRTITADPELDADVLILTTFDVDADVFAALEAGAAGFLLKGADEATLLAAIRSVAAGEGTLDQRLTRRILREFSERRREAPAATMAPAESPLTEREFEVLDLLAQGLSNAEIADRLVLSVRTVESHIYRAMHKLGVSDRRDL